MRTASATHKARMRRAAHSLCAQSARLLLLISAALLVFPWMASAQEVCSDASLAGAITAQSYTNKATLAAHVAAQAAEGIGHNTQRDKVDRIVNINKKYIDYLHKFNNVLSYATAGYGLYVEIKDLAKNIEGLDRLLAENPTGGLATALDKDKKNMFLDMGTVAGDIVYDICSLFSDSVMMTETQRYQTLHDLRPKVQRFNQRLRMMQLSIKYGSLHALFSKLLHRLTPARTPSEIAIDCYQEWAAQLYGDQDKAAWTQAFNEAMDRDRRFNSMFKRAQRTQQNNKTLASKEKQNLAQSD